MRYSQPQFYRNMLKLSVIFAALLTVASKLVFKPDGTFKILHVSDVHYEMPLDRCADILPSQKPCNHKNSSAFLSWLIETEKPDLVVHTGDIVDWATYPATKGMQEYYNVSYSHGVPWAASLGNHDDDSITMRKREDVLDYILTLPGALTEKGPVADSYGNFILEIFPNVEAVAPAARTYHFDSDTQVSTSVSPAQVNWFSEQSAKLNAAHPAPALAFFHVPLYEYQTAVDSGLPISGGFHEAICHETENSGLFEAFKAAGDVKAGFCGHDHTNDFCVLYEGVQLCYEGSPGYQCYGNVDVPRRARVTELRDFGHSMSSWKRLDMSTGNGAVVDEEVIWTAAGDNKAESKVVRYPVDKEVIKALPRREQKENMH